MLHCVKYAIPYKKSTILSLYDKMRIKVSLYSSKFYPIFEFSVWFQQFVKHCICPVDLLILVERFNNLPKDTLKIFDDFKNKQQKYMK